LGYALFMHAQPSPREVSSTEEEDTATARELFGGLYEIAERLDWNGLCLVFHARQGSRAVTLALLPIDCEGRPERESAFERGAAALAGLTHPNMIPILAHGVRHGVPFLELETVEARTLAQELAQGPIARSRAIEITRQVLVAMEHAHSLGVFHLDLTPTNVLLTRRNDGVERVSVLGFGFAQLIASVPGGRPATGTGGSGAHPMFYRAPEVAAGGPPTNWGDFYSVGALFYHMLMDRPLAPDAPPPPEDMVPFIARAVAKDPGQRYPDAASMRRGLRSVAGLTEESQSDELPGAPRARRRRGRGWLLASGGLLVLLGGAAGVAEAGLLGPDLTVTALVGSLRSNAPAGGHRASVAPDGAGRSAPAKRAPRQDPAPREGVETGPSAAEPAAQPTETGEGPDMVFDAPEAGLEPPVEGTAEPEGAGFRAQERGPLAGPIAEELLVFRDQINAGTELSREELAPLIEYARAQRDDPCGHLLLARAFMNLRWTSDAIDRYVLAYQIDPASADDPYLIPHMIQLVQRPEVGGEASIAIRRTVGPLALPEIERVFSPDLPWEPRRRLERLRSQLISMQR